MACLFVILCYNYPIIEAFYVILHKCFHPLISAVKEK